MRFEVAGRIPRAPDAVYRAMRDDLATLASRLPEIERIEVVSRDRVADGRMRIVTRWHVRPKLPEAVLRRVPGGAFSWTDDSLWCDETRRVDYRIEGFAYAAKGANVFEVAGRGTRIGVGGDLEIDPAPLRVPRLLFRAALPVVERRVRAGLESNLRKLIGALRAHLDAA